MPGLRYRLSIGLWTNFIVFNCQVVEGVLFFAKPAFKKPGIFIRLFVDHERRHSCNCHQSVDWGDYNYITIQQDSLLEEKNKSTDTVKDDKLTTFSDTFLV